MDKIFPQAVSMAVAVGVGLIAMYFTQRTQTEQIYAQVVRNDKQDIELVRKDVLEPQLEVMRGDLSEIKQDVKALLQKR